MQTWWQSDFYLSRETTVDDLIKVGLFDGPFVVAMMTSDPALCDVPNIIVCSQNREALAALAKNWHERYGDEREVVPAAASFYFNHR
jgi:hypothetical protein